MATKRLRTVRLRTFKRWRAGLVILMAAGLLSSTRPAQGCGPFMARAVFTYEKHPDFPLARFAAGDLGVIEPTYARSYLVVAYRYFAGVGLDHEEQKAALAVWDERVQNHWDSNTEDWGKAWLEALVKIPGVNTKPKLDVYRSEDRKDFYLTFLNCPKDAFRNAAETLNRLIAKYGAASPEAK